MDLLGTLIWVNRTDERTNGRTDERTNERTDSLLELAGFYPAAKNFGTECKTRFSASNSSFGSKAKMSRFASNSFCTLYQFSGSLSITIEYQKKMLPLFSFRQDMAHFNFGHGKKLKF